MSRSFALSLVCLMMSGAAMVSVTTTTNNLLQTLVTDEMRGRVMSMYTFSFLGLPPLGSLLVGALADLIGPHWNYHGAQIALAVSGAVVLIFAVCVTLAVPRLRALE
jgi:MFS family permease